MTTFFTVTLGLYSPIVRGLCHPTPNDIILGIISRYLPI
jgi:hypothetical protein